MTQPVPRPRSGKRRQLIALAVVVLVFVALAVAAVLSKKGNPASAKVGECVHQTGANSLKVVGCTGSDADFKVVGKVEGKDRIESTIAITSVCDQWPQTTTTYWRGRQGKKGTVLCLAKAS